MKSVTIKAALITAGATILVGIFGYFGVSKNKYIYKDSSVNSNNNQLDTNYGDNYQIQGDATIINNQYIEKNVKSNIKINNRKKLVFMISGKEVFPEEGKVYTIKGIRKSIIKYMYKNDLIYIEYTTPDGNITTYNVLDRDGNLIENKLPFKLEEYQVVFDDNDIVNKNVENLNNGFQKIHIKLKWDNSITMVTDSIGKLQQLTYVGGVVIDNRNKIIKSSHNNIDSTQLIK